MKHIIKISLGLFSLCLVGCNSSSEDNTESTVPVVEQSLPTTKVSFQFNFPVDDPVLDTQHFSNDDSLTYNGAVGITTCSAGGEKQELNVYFVHTSQTRWDVYFIINDEHINIAGGEAGGLGIQKATLAFDESGNFTRQYPYLLQSTEIQIEDKSYSIEFDFYSLPSTTTDPVFNVMGVEKNGTC